MSAELAAVAGFAIAAAGSFLATPVAITVARRTDFYDHPREYRQHSRSTPLLGGASVLAGVLIAAIVIGGLTGRLLVLLGCAVGLWALGTADDRSPVAPKWRLLAEAGASIALLAAGLGFKTSGGGAVDAVLTLIWIVGLCNAFNLMDNLDGACGTVGCVSGLGIGTLAAIDGQATLAGLAFALAGACAAFLRWNLAAPARVFLGDGGSMAIGFLVAALAMATARGLHVGDESLLAVGLLAGLPILDTTLVSVSRTRRGVPLVTGGRDHLSHRLLMALGSPRAVAATLGLVQAILCALAVAGARWGEAALASFALVAVVAGVAAIVVLDSRRWRPPAIAVGDAEQRLRAAPVGADHG